MLFYIEILTSMYLGVQLWNLQNPFILKAITGYHFSQRLCAKWLPYWNSFFFPLRDEEAQLFFLLEMILSENKYKRSILMKK